MLPVTAITTLLLASQVVGQSSSSSASQVTLSESEIATSLLVPTGPYSSYGSTTTFSRSSSALTPHSTSVSNYTSTEFGTTSTSSVSQTVLVGTSKSTSTGNSTSSSTSSSAPSATNTTPCNGYPEFCSRKFSNVSMVVAHNSPFDVPHNAASNQVYDVTQQLNDGIRGLQFETHMPNNTIRLCHTSCDLLDAGTLEAYLATVVKWLDSNPYEVIAIMMGNDDRVNPENYVAPFTNSGILRYVYTTPQNPMPLSAWPTLSEMILSQKRVVVMLDYLANQTAIPWLLDEFTQQWETPFSPTELSFPCTEQRPPGQTQEISENRMYMTNHNLNIEISVASISLLVPAYGLLDQTNSANFSTFGSLQRGVDNCIATWNRPPNFLLVDYYNYGNFNGSVFQVAARANNVTYNRADCCGTSGPASSGARSIIEFDLRGVLLGVVVLFIALA